MRIAFAILLLAVSLDLALRAWEEPRAAAAQRSTPVETPRAAAGPWRIIDVVTSVDQNRFPWLVRPLTAFLMVLPFALFVAAARHLGSTRRPLLDMAGWLFAVYMLLHGTFLVSLLPVGARTEIVFVAFTCIAWPLLVLRPSAVAEPGPLVPRVALIAVAAFVAAIFATFYLREDVASALAGVALAAAGYWLMRELGGGVVHALVLVVAAVGLTFVRESVVALPFAALFFFGSMLAVRRGFARLTWIALAVMLAIAAIVALLLVPFRLYDAVRVLVDAAVYPALLAVAAAFVILLREHSASSGASRDAVAAGIAFALSSFYFHRVGVYGAVVTGSSYLFLRYWLFARAAENLAAVDAAQIREGVAKLIALHEAERTIDRRRRKLLAKVEDGSENWAAYETCTAELEAVIRTYEQDTASMETSRRALAHGPLDPPWQRGLSAARLAALLAIPWCLVYAAVYSTEPVPWPPQWWLRVFAELALGFAQWPLLGFFFGYFYPDIRGRNGLTKALAFFVTVVVPPLLAFVVFEADLPTFIFALWILQNFIQAMVLGLFAGDYRTLRDSGLGWRHLRDVHHLGVLTAYGTSVIVAIGAAISTAIAGGVIDTLKSLAK